MRGVDRDSGRLVDRISPLVHSGGLEARGLHVARPGRFQGASDRVELEREELADEANDDAHVAGADELGEHLVGEQVFGMHDDQAETGGEGQIRVGAGARGRESGKQARKREWTVLGVPYDQARTEEEGRGWRDEGGRVGSKQAR